MMFRISISATEKLYKGALNRVFTAMIIRNNNIIFLLYS